MNRLRVLVSIFVLFFCYTNSAEALGFRRPEPGPTPTPTPIPAPCSTAGSEVPNTPDEYVVHLKAFNGKYVVAECGGDDVGEMNTNRDAAGVWEKFYVKPVGNGNVVIRTSNGRYVASEGGGGGEVHSNRREALNWETFRLEGKLSNGATVGFRTENGHYITSRLDIENAPIMATAPSYGPWEQYSLEVTYAPPVPARKGLVRADHRSIRDDDGHFYPLGQTLFWALRGWKFERERVKANLQFLKQQKWDYVRILGEVDWGDNSIEPSWPDYDQNLAEFLDYAYNEAGLRTEITILGGGHEDQVMSLTQRIANVVRGREHMIMNFEVANESYQRRISLEDMRRVGRFLRQQFPNHLVAISSGEGTSSYKDSGDWRADFIDVYMRPDSANLGTIHMDRGFGDEGWRAARQPWDWKDLNFPMSHNEPIGPRSSVAQEDDPVRLAMIRAVGIINGVPMFVLHNANGVAGRVDPARNRQANIYELANVDAIMKAIRGIDAFLPARVGEGNHWNNAWAGNPCVADAIWASGEGSRGVNRNYTVSTGDGWVQTEGGVKSHVNMIVSQRSFVEVFDVIQGKVMELNLEAGQSFRLSPVSRDNFGNGAFIIVGHYL